MTAIIILNWNGWRDTLACLDSLKVAQGQFRVLVVDNGSSDESVPQIKDYLKANPTLDAELYEAGDNYGFAKGNNEGLRYIADRWNADHYLLLNNDTVVEPDFLTELEKFAAEHPEYKAMTPVICYDYDRSIIWNCGGWLNFGLRKDYYANGRITEVKELDPKTLRPLVSHIDVTYLTGCALFFSQDLLDQNHRLLTEDFFFGEEDFNFCLRMKSQKKKMACVMSSKIYHKVNGSIKDRDTLSKIYIYYLNRYIDVRKCFSPLKYLVWVTMSSLYAILLLTKLKYGFGNSVKLMCKVIKDSSRMDKVTQKDFLEAIKGKVI